ncbi:MAG: helix-turn-helix domain-containing protein [Puniceicoccaceae bacterium]
MNKNRHKADDCLPLTEAVERGEVSLVARVRKQYPGRPIKPGRLPGLLTVGYWDATGHQTWGLPPHRNEGIEICYLLSGEAFFGTNHDSWVLKPGDITITRPWQQHYLGDPTIRPCKLFWIILDIESSDGRNGWSFPSWIGPDIQSRRELLRIFRKNQRCHIADEEKLLAKFLEHACEHMNDDGSLVIAQLADLINHVLLTVANYLSKGIHHSTSDPEGYNQSIRQFFLGLEASVDKCAESWTVAEIARACRVGVTYLTASCKKLFNATPSEQLKVIRLAHAAKLLEENPDLSITEITHSVGFNSSQYFATSFKRKYGQMPTKFRANL